MDLPLTDKKIGADGSFRDSVATIDEQGRRRWVFPTKPAGRLHSYRLALSIFYLGLFFLLPLVKVGGEPIFLFNILERKFILFGMIFWPQDFFILGLGMLIFIIFIALFTVIYGRVFCGWACPQTVFMEMVFRKIEYWVEGDAAYQKALAKSKWNAQKILKRATKYSLFYLVSFLIANTFLAYIIGVDRLFAIASEPVRAHAGGFAALMLFTSVFFFVYAWFREQVCIIVCPYGRMQGVLLDKNSIVVAYDYLRGEPRHKFNKREADRKGDCIDCSLCVKVCPTGIDIRNGTQLECVNCTACIDACNHMMDNVGLPRNLIRYDSENGIAQGKKLKFTNRIKAYSLALVLLVAVEVFLLAGRSDVDATILRARGMLYQEQPGNQVSNLYTIKLVNKTRRSIPIELKVENYPATVMVIGKKLDVAKEEVEQGQFFVFLDKKDIQQRKTKIKIGIYEEGKKIRTVATNFMGPVATQSN
jgi:cytochrome c oxidase accessory protein FixG